MDLTVRGSLAAYFTLLGARHSYFNPKVPGRVTIPHSLGGPTTDPHRAWAGPSATAAATSLMHASHHRCAREGPSPPCRSKMAATSAAWDLETSDSFDSKQQSPEISPSESARSSSAELSEEVHSLPSPRGGRDTDDDSGHAEDSSNEENNDDGPPSGIARPLYFEEAASPYSNLKAMMCILIFVGTNGETYYNTTSLVSCIQSFPKNRGPVVGILKGFAGLSGAILTQIYAMMHSRDQASIIFMVAVGPALVVISLMFVVRPVGGHRQAQSSDNATFMFINFGCLLLAAYLIGIFLLQDLVNLSKAISNLFTIVLLILLIIPIVIPLLFTFYFDVKSPTQECLLPTPCKPSPSTNDCETIFSGIEDEIPKEVDSLSLSEREKRIAEVQAKLIIAEAVGAVTVKRRKGPRRGEDFTLIQALIKADFGLLFISLLLGTGTGLTVIDNLGQLSQSLGYDGSHIFVSMISIWNFLGRIAGGYLSEIIVREKTYPRPVALAVAQAVMAVGHFLIAMAWPGTMYIGTFLIGIPYGAHWAIVPATASELFGVKHFGALYNFLAVATPVGSLIFSGIITSSIYDHEAEKQAHMRTPIGTSLYARPAYTEEALKCDGVMCFFLSSLIMSGVCVFGVFLSMLLVYRTKSVYIDLYGKART